MLARTVSGTGATRILFLLSAIGGLASAAGCSKDDTSGDTDGADDAGDETSPEPSPVVDDPDDDTSAGDDDDLPAGDDDSPMVDDDTEEPDVPAIDAGSNENPEPEGVADASVPGEPVTPADAGANLAPEDSGLLDAGNEPDVQPTIDSGEEDNSTDSDAGPAGGKLVFATSTTYTGALGGLAGADQLCAMHADAAGLSGEFKAWLSTLDTSAVSRLSHSDEPYVRTDGVVIAEDFDDLLDGTLLAPIARNEFGELATGDTWTGTLASGEPYPNTDCLGFTDGTFASSAQCGNTQSTAGAWTENIVPACISSLRLYCFEQ